MLNIKSLYLGNYRIFNELQRFDLAPVSILTGVNSSGKSSIVKSLNLLKNINFKSYPYTIRFDKDQSNSLSFGLIKNHSSKEDQIILGYNIYNSFLGQTVNVVLYIENKNDFEGIVKKIQIQHKDEVLLMLEFEGESKTSVYANLEYFLNILKNFIILKERFLKFEELIRDDDDISSSYRISTGVSVSNMTYDEENGRFRKMTNEEAEAEIEKRKVIKKEFSDFISNNPLSETEKKWLKDFYETGGYIKGERPLEDQWHTIIKSFNKDDILFNHTLLEQLANIPQNELNAANIKNIIKDNLPDQGQYVDEEAIDESIRDILNTLLIQQYSLKESSIIKENNSVWNIEWIGEAFADRISHSIDEYGKAIFETDPFYKLFHKVTLNNRKNMFSEDWNKFYRSPDNLLNLLRYVALVFKKTEEDLFNDINSIVHVPLSSLSVNRLLDFNHPLHKLIVEYKGSLEKNSFIKYWLKEFDVCDKFSIEAPVAGLGYSLLLSKKRKKIQLFDEGMGTVHLITILLNIAVYESRYPRKGETTIILEEPEANMHPAWQSKLADMFVDATDKMGVHFIIETHSEYLVRKLQNLIAKKKVIEDNVMIHYIGKTDPKTKSPDVRNIRINPNGILSEEFGPGFFDEADNLALQLFTLRKSQNN